MAIDDEQTLLTNCRSEEDKDCFHEITVSGSAIVITSTEQDEIQKVSIKHNCKEWTTLYIEYSVIKTEPTHYTYIINGETGTFNFKSPDMISSGLLLGGRYDDTRFFKGEISSLEVYFTASSNNNLPQPLRNLIINNQYIKKRHTLDKID